MPSVFSPSLSVPLGCVFSCSHCAGTIGAVGNNGKGVVGVCQSGVKIISMKFIGPRGGYDSNAILALDYLLELKTQYNLNLVATSNSWWVTGSASLEESFTEDIPPLGIAAAPAP